MRRMIAVLYLLCTFLLATPAHGATTRQSVTIVLVRDPLLSQTTLPDATLTAGTFALTRYLNHDVASAWPLPHFTVTAILTSTVPLVGDNATWIVNLRPYATVVNAVGWHSVDKHNNPIGEIGVAEELDNQIPWITAISHELAEMAVDPYSSSSAVDYSVSYGYERTITAKVYALELCDPVYHFWYALRWGGVTYMMSDFVYPSYFNHDARYPFDKGHHVRAPFTPAGDGYQSSMSATGYAWEGGR